MRLQKYPQQKHRQQNKPRHNTTKHDKKLRYNFFFGFFLKNAQNLLKVFVYTFSVPKLRSQGRHSENFPSQKLEENAKQKIRGDVPHLGGRGGAGGALPVKPR